MVTLLWGLPVHTRCDCLDLVSRSQVFEEQELQIVFLTILSSVVLTFFIPSNSEWVTSPGPSNIGAKRSEVGKGHENPDKNAHISTVNTAVMPSLYDTMSLSSFPVDSDSSTHPPSESSTLCELSSSMKIVYPMLQKTNISLTSHGILADLNIKTGQ